MVESINGQGHLTEFDFKGTRLPVEYVETVDVAEGVRCDVYKFVGDTEKDLAIIKIDKGFATPRQRVLKGDKTIEGYVSGVGTLTVTNSSGRSLPFSVGIGCHDSFSTLVGVGEIMQWEADKDSELVVYEVCYPPYKAGRFADLPSNS